MQSNKVRYRRTGNYTWTMLICVILIFFALVGFLFGAAEPEKPSADRSRVYKLNHRTAEEIKDCLLQLGIGRRVDALSENILIVTSDKPTDLIRTSSVLQILDNKAPRSFRQWMPAETVVLPDNAYLLSHLDMAEINVGTLLDPPPVNVPQPVIVDMQGDVLVVIGATELIDRADSVIREWTAQRRGALPPPSPAAEPNQPAQPPAAAESTAPAPAEVVPAVPEVKAAPEPNLPAPAEMDLLPVPVTVPVKPPVAEIPAAAEPKPAEPNSEDDFFSAELLKALTAAQEKAEQLQEEIEVEKHKSEEVEDETAEDKAFLEIIEALRRKSEDVPEEIPAAEEKPQEALGEAAPAAVPQPADKSPLSDLAQLQEQLARQEQQIAELKALLIERARPSEPKIRIAPEMSEPEIPEGEKELELTISLPEKVEITWLLELVGKQLGLNYMYDPAQVKGDVTLKVHDGKIKVKDAYALLESVLRFRGFVMTRRGNLVTIVPASQIKQAEPVIRGPGEPMEPGDVIVSSVFHLSNISPAAAQKMLTDMQLGTSFVAVAETNSLIVTDYAYRMDRIDQVITLVDVAGEPKTFTYRQLQYTSASEMVTKLKTLTAQIGGVSVAGAPEAPAAPVRAAPAPVQRDARGRVIAAPPAGQPAAPAPAASAAQAAAPDAVYLDIDDRTNRIVMIGYPTQIKTINELIDTLDVPKYYIRYVREYFIQHVEAAEIITALNDLGLANVVVGSGTAADRQAIPTRAVPTRGQPVQAGQPPQPVQQTTAASGEDQPYISIRPNTNSLLVNATKEQHDAIELVILHVDVRQKDQRTIHEYEIQNVDAMQIVKTMEDLGIISPGRSTQDTASARSGTGRTASGRQAAGQPVQQPGQPEMPIPMALPTMEGETVTELTASEPQIAVLESTNSLLVNATSRQHTAISLIIAHVDRTLEQISTPYVVYPLENQDPDELAGVLNELIQETLEQAQKSAPDAKIQTAGTPATTTLLPSREEERIRIISDPKTYSLIVYANKKNQQWVGELIKELDEYRPQVLLDVTLVDISQKESFEYDLDMIVKTYGGETMKSGQIAPLTNFSLGRYGEAITNSGNITAFFNSENVQALLTAVQTKGYGRVMARPKILVNDNQEGEIKTENTTSVAQIKSNIIPGTGTSNTVTTTDVTFADYQEGVTLKIKPHISKGDMLRLEITLNRTDFTLRPAVEITTPDGPASFPSPPDRLATDVTTVSTIPDGTTIILGGLEGLKQQKDTTKVPLLGDIPLVGGLFRSVKDTGEQNRLYVFVKANIIRPGNQLEGLADIRRVSGRYRMAFEELEQRFQKMEDWPGIKPKPMDPERVLEDDEVQVSEEESLY